MVYYNGRLYDANGVCADCGTYTLEGSEPVFSPTGVTFIPHTCH